MGGRDELMTTVSEEEFRTLETGSCLEEDAGSDGTQENSAVEEEPAPEEEASPEEMSCEENGAETAPDSAGKLAEEEVGSKALSGDCPTQADSRNTSKNTGNMDLYFRMSSFPSARFSNRLFR